MKTFNPEKELKKIQHGNKSKMIFSIIFGIILVTIGYSFALYQVRYSKRIIYTKVADFSRDVNIMAVFVDNTKVDDFPTKTQGKVYDQIVCDDNNDNHVKAYWDYEKWGLVVETTKKAKCNVYFKTSTDTSGANSPELYQGLIPVTIDDAGKFHVANLTTDWYDYDNKRWANAVLVDASNETIKTKYFNEDKSLKTDIFGDEIPIGEILQMYVWVPRYKYQLFNVNNEGVEEQEIKIEFESGTLSTGTVECNISDKGVESCNNAIKGEWYTHPAFTFGSTELKGLWVGKFETNGNAQALTIKPNITAWRNVTVSIMFNASRNMENLYANNFNLDKDEIDTHMMKNMEWGAMTYLTYSKYGRCEADGLCSEVAVNTRNDYITGYNGTTYTWVTLEGQKASTTGNMYGIYDTSGGSWEYIMGNMLMSDGSFYSSSAQFQTVPNEKYYNKYEYSSSGTTHQRGHLGDATRETLKTFGIETGGWYGDYARFPNATSSWFLRGGLYAFGVTSGTFAFLTDSGRPHQDDSFRMVLTAQDGNE